MGKTYWGKSDKRGVWGARALSCSDVFVFWVCRSWCVCVCVCQPVWGWMKVDPGASGMSGEGEGVGVGVVSPPCVAFWVGL